MGETHRAGGISAQTVVCRNESAQERMRWTHIYAYLVWGLCSAPTGDMLPSWARGGRIIDLHVAHQLC